MKDEEQEESENQEERSDASRSRRIFWGRALSLLFIALSLISYVRDGKPRFVPLPMKPLEVAANTTAVPAIPGAPGALRGRNVVMVTLDTTRPDRLGFYGNRSIQTPTLDRLAAEGVIFSNAVATATSTLPTHSSIFTGLYPHHHGARANGLYRLAPEQRTLAEMLSDEGYDTAAFVSAFVLAEQFGLNQGFAHYDDETGALSVAAGYAERRAEDTTNRAIEWLKAKRSRPYFLWVHYFDPHQAHTPPARFREQNSHPYDGEIAYMDHELRRLLDEVRRTSEDERLIVVTADHGEALGEHGEQSHPYLAYDATLRIPLIMHAPETFGRGRHMSSRVSQVDLLPTIASLLGMEVSQTLDGVDLATEIDPHRAVISEVVEGQVNFGWAGLAVLYRGSLKYIDGPNPELFDLARDPLEKRNLVSEQHLLADEMKRSLRTLRKGHARLPARVASDLEPADVARLEALGYLVSATSNFEPGRNGPDPRSQLALLHEVFFEMSKIPSGPPRSMWDELLTRIRGHRATPGETISALETMSAAHPDFAPVYRHLAALYDSQGRSEDAARARELLDQQVRGSSGPKSSRSDR